MHLIDADLLVHKIESAKSVCATEHSIEIIKILTEAVKKMPTVDIAADSIKYGYWISLEEIGILSGNLLYYRCSNCKKLMMALLIIVLPVVQR